MEAILAMNDDHLLEELQRSKQELALAYEATIEGWVRALDLRDRETEGHTRRVTELTLRLARAMGISDEQLVHIRRGALLHDIGKMGVPDAILFKPGKLTEEELKLMQRHPVLGYQLLSTIPFLQPALDIVYCHHERWDGSGYPRGLKGEEIPLSARIFAVVDVWDALVSERVFRRSSSKDEAIAYIKEIAGVKLDPQVVEAFLEVIHG
jgi:putative nucleotidyltransferase with HDIG domain